VKLRTIASIFLLLGIALAGCTAPGKPDKNKKPAAKKEDAKQDESSDVDFQAFVSRLRKAVEARDMSGIAQMMIKDFAYVMGSTPEQDRKGDGVFQYWDENGLWPELEGILSEKFVKKGDYMVAPPQFANPAIDYDGYRAGLRRVSGSWKFAYFVNGSAPQ
jgi:hypothetical protein